VILAVVSRWIVLLVRCVSLITCVLTRCFPDALTFRPAAQVCSDMYKDKPISKPWKAYAVISTVLLIGMVILFVGSSSRGPAQPGMPPVTNFVDVADHVTEPDPADAGGYAEDEELSITHYKCFQSSEYAEICVYDLLCFDGDKVGCVWAVGD
jgi:hypothetical protein